jgi:hypothetical protein
MRRSSREASPAPEPERGRASSVRNRRVKSPALLSEALELRRLPGVRIEMSGDERCRELYDFFTQRHARWRLIQNKRWGVALIRLPDAIGDYDRRISRLARRRIKHAKQSGFTFTRIDPLVRLEEVLAVNRSASERQGLPMHPDYFEEETVRRYFGRAADVFGVVDANGVLSAYLCVRVCGEVACIERLLGHADALEQGVMYLLISGVVEWLIQEPVNSGHPSWLMYDMFSGASPGMRHFKHVIGCEPYRVSWSWRA